MNYVVAQNVLDLRAEPESSSELVSQAICGVKVTVLAEQGDYARIATEDRYEGWAAKARLTPTWDEADYFKTCIATLFADLTQSPDPHSEILTKLVASTNILIDRRPEIGDYVPVILPDLTAGYINKVCLNVTHESVAGSEMLDEKQRHEIDVDELKRTVLKAIGFQAAETAMRLIGTPYLWGGCTPFGIDCSGLVQFAYKINGIQLLRDARLQFHDRRFMKVEHGGALPDSLFEPGDLLAFGSAGQEPITHIGLALGDGRFVHAAGGRGVRVDECLEPKYEAMYAGAVRISPDADLSINAA